MRTERTLILERLVKTELTLQRLLASSRRTASARMSTLRRAKAASVVASLVTRPRLRAQGA